jgi:phage terminase large subunit-like protein
LPDWTTALPDWERRITAGESLLPCGPLFERQANLGLETFAKLRAVDVPGSPTLGDISRPWLRDLVRVIFGAYDEDAGRQLIREVFLLIPKKNGKSTDAAGIILTALLLNWRQSAEMGILAPTIEVANNAWRPARDAIKADPGLSKLLHVQDHIRTITHRRTGATLQVVAADSEAVAGKKWSVTLVDELWLFGKRPNADRMLLEATGGMASRPEGFVMYLSTQSDEPPAGVFREKLRYARGVRDGRIKDPAFLPVLYELPASMSREAREPRNFGLVNPNLGASVDEEFLLREFRKAEEVGEDAVRGFLAKHLNLEIGLALRSDRWAGADLWEDAGDDAFTLESLLARCDVVEVGIDGGGLDDLLGLCVLGREASTGVWVAWFRAWAHPIVLERRKSEAARLRDFERQGDLVLVEAIGQDVAEVVEIVAQVHAAGVLGKVGVDPAGIGAILDALQEIGLSDDQIVGINQGWRLAGAIKTCERKLAAQELRHTGSALMAWCVSNARIEPRANATMITKQASGTAKIDPLMALFNAAELLSRAPAQVRIDDFLQQPVIA